MQNQSVFQILHHRSRVSINNLYEYKLRQELLSNMNIMVRPVTSSSNAVNMTFCLTVFFFFFLNWHLICWQCFQLLIHDPLCLSVSLPVFVFLSVCLFVCLSALSLGAPIFCLSDCLFIQIDYSYYCQRELAEKKNRLLIIPDGCCPPIIHLDNLGRGREANIIKAEACVTCRRQGRPITLNL